MRTGANIALLFSLLLIPAGCDTASAPPTDPHPTAQSARAPTDGRNLAPELQRDVGSDPLWPNDIDRGGGGGVR